MNGHSCWWEEPSAADTVRSYANLAGLLVQSSPSDPTTAMNISTTLVPSKFPREQFDLVIAIQPDLNTLLDKASRDLQFVEETMRSVIKVDDFARRLFQLHLDVQRSLPKDKPVVLMCRSDYMLTLPHGHDWACADEQLLDDIDIKQVEMNVISCSLAGMSGGPIQKLHRFVNSRYGKDKRELNMPETSRFVDTLAVASKAFGNSSACILFVVDAEDANSYDQRMPEFELWERDQIKVIRKTFEELGREARHGPNQELLVLDVEVAVVYYRTAFTPAQYASEKDWATRLLLETSRAPNCPSIAMQLVGSKRVQQMLTVPGVLEKFMDDEDRIARVRSVFAGQFSLATGDEGDAAIDKALKNPHDFVLKPEREGGGNNFYDDDLLEKLKAMKDSKEREGYLLMERLSPPRQTSLFLNAGSTRIESADITCELGVYGMYVRHGDRVLLNQAGSAMSRSKITGTNEAGVYIGSGKLDMVDVVSNKEFLQSVSK